MVEEHIEVPLIEQVFTQEPLDSQHNKDIDPKDQSKEGDEINKGTKQ